MNAPEKLPQNEGVATPEAYYSKQIAEALATLGELARRAQRNEIAGQVVDTEKARLHAILDEAIEQIEWLAQKQEFGDMDPARFGRPQR